MQSCKNNKIEMLAGLSVINDNALAVQILKSDAFSVINIVDHLTKLQAESDNSFKNLIKFTANSPFFIEGDKHGEIKKIFAHVLGKSSINVWQSQFEHKVESVTLNFKQPGETDIVSYCFDLAKELLRPVIFGTESELPDDFEKRLYHFQKLAEPLLSMRQLVKLENEIDYFLSSVKNCLNSSAECLPNSLLHYLNADSTADLSYDDKLMLLIIIYGAKTPLIQTLANTFLDILVDNREHYFSGGVFNEEYFLTQLDQLLLKSASLLHIHRVAVKDFTYGDFKVKEGDFALIQIKDSSESQCRHYKNLSFGFRTHYCSGAIMSRAIIAMVVPKFFKIYPNTTVQAWEYDPSIHTAKALTTLKVNIE